MPLPPGVGPFGIQPGQTIGSYLDDVIKRTIEEGPKARLQQKALREKEKQSGGEDDIFGDTGGDEGEEQAQAAPEAPGPGDDAGAEQAPEPEADPGSMEEPDLEAPASPDTGEIGRQMGGPQKKVADDDVEALKRTPEMADVVDKLNAVRSGRSFKDDAVRDSFRAYYDGLDPEERTALFAFLKGIAQVTSGEVPGDQAVEPDTTPSPGIEMTRSGQQSDSPEGEQQQSPGSRSIKPNVVRGAEPKDSPYVDQDKPAEDTTPPVQAKRRG